MGSSRSILQSTGMSPEVRDLHVAVMRNDVEAVLTLSENGIDLDRPWCNCKQPSVKDGSTPLCQAVSLNHRQVVEVLLEEGALVNKPNGYGCTPLHKAAFHGRASLTKLLVAAGGDVHLKDRDCNAPLHTCVQNGPVHNSAETVRTLIGFGASVNEPNRFGKIALHYAALWGLGEITDVLIKAGSSIDYTDLKWRTPLYCCILPSRRTKNIWEQQSPAVKVLLTSGCDSLNLATWMRKNILPGDPELLLWYTSALPESLKHLCRRTIQNILHYHDDNASRIFALPLPLPVNNYLARKLL